MKKLGEQILRFGIVGILAFAIDYILLYGFTEWCHIYYLLSACLSFTISLIFNYIASTKWVFNVDETKDRVAIGIVFVVLSIIGLVMNQLIMWCGVEVVRLHYMLVKIGATAVVMVFNFVTRKIFLES